ncbi:eukaryotic translation initiation factor 1, partial [Trichinella spiralis]|uniref:eukaryotic translation initiation factor 1 n=1 Tax=Trichinella spiralis TaxID=6334 RepID=UPI0001EFCF4F
MKATFKVATVIQHSNFRNLDFKDFVQVLQLTHRFSDFAGKYVKNAAVDLTEVVNEKSIAYFAALHPYCIEQLGLHSEVLICPSVDDMDPILSNSALMLLRYI